MLNYKKRINLYMMINYECIAFLLIYCIDKIIDLINNFDGMKTILVLITLISCYFLIELMTVSLKKINNIKTKYNKMDRQEKKIENDVQSFSKSSKFYYKRYMTHCIALIFILILFIGLFIYLSSNIGWGGEGSLMLVIILLVLVSFVFFSCYYLILMYQDSRYYRSTK